MNAEAERQATAPFDFLGVGRIIGRRKKQGDKKYATFRRRLWAATIDSLLLLVTAPLFYYLFPIKSAALQQYMAGNAANPQLAALQLAQGLASPEFIRSWLINMMAQMLAFCLYSAVCWHFWSATPGKMLMLVKIADAETEKPITDRQILIRVCGYVVSSVCLFLGFFWIGLDKRRQGWHDKMAHTVVITVPWREQFGRLLRRG